MAKASVFVAKCDAFLLALHGSDPCELDSKETLAVDEPIRLVVLQAYLFADPVEVMQLGEDLEGEL